MIKRVLVSCAVLLAAAFIACSGDSGTADLPQKPQIQTDRDSIVDRLFVGQGRDQTLGVTNGGKDDLVVSTLTLTATDPGLLNPLTLSDGGVITPFALKYNQLIDSSSNPDSGVVLSNTVKSNRTSFVALSFARPPPGMFQAADGGIYKATLTISSNAENSPTKVIALESWPNALPDGGHGP